MVLIKYRPFHKTLPSSSAFVNWISVRFYETDCSWKRSITFSYIIWKAGGICSFSFMLLSTFWYLAWRGPLAWRPCTHTSLGLLCVCYWKRNISQNVPGIKLLYNLSTLGWSVLSVQAPESCQVLRGCCKQRRPQLLDCNRVPNRLK